MWMIPYHNFVLLILKCDKATYILIKLHIDVMGIYLPTVVSAKFLEC